MHRSSKPCLKRVMGGGQEWIIPQRRCFVQGLILKWQEKVLPSATSFSDALHQARLAEEQHKQLGELHKGCLQEQPLPKKTAGKTTDSGSASGETIPNETSSNTFSTTSRFGCCFKCGSLRHKAWGMSPMTAPHRVTRSIRDQERY